MLCQKKNIYKSSLLPITRWIWPRIEILRVKIRMGNHSNLCCVALSVWFYILPNIDVFVVVLIAFLHYCWNSMIWASDLDSACQSTSGLSFKT